MERILRVCEKMCDWRPAVRHTVVVSTIVVAGLTPAVACICLQAAGVI